MLLRPGIGVLKPLFQPNARHPAQGLEPRHGQQPCGAPPTASRQQNQPRARQQQTQGQGHEQGGDQALQVKTVRRGLAGGAGRGLAHARAAHYSSNRHSWPAMLTSRQSDDVLTPNWGCQWLPTIRAWPPVTRQATACPSGRNHVPVAPCAGLASAGGGGNRVGEGVGSITRRDLVHLDPHGRMQMKPRHGLSVVALKDVAHREPLAGHAPTAPMHRAPRQPAVTVMGGRHATALPAA